MANPQDATTIKELVISFRADRAMHDALKQVSDRDRLSIADVVRLNLLKMLREMKML